MAIMDLDILLNIFAVGIRFYMGRTFLNEYFQGRPEISTPANSMLRIKEGIALHQNGISPYEGDTFHGAPLWLFIFRYLFEKCPLFIEIIFPLCDLITAIALENATKRYLLYVKRKDKAKYGDDGKEKDIGSLLVTDEDILRLPRTAKLLYLFNPLSIVSCVAHTTTTLNNAIIASSLSFMVSKYFSAAIILVAIASYTDFYPFILISPIIVWFALDSKGFFDHGRVLKSTILALFGWTISIAILLGCSYFFCDGWSFLEGTYGFILSAQDLTPNPGLFWYFFTEMFDQFRLFFTWVFQLNPIVYVAPLTVCIRDDAVMLFHQLLTIITIFKSYPSVGDAALVLSFLPALTHLSKYIRHRFIIGVSFVACAVLAPIMWYLWIHAGSANANFYFAITLVYSTAHIFLLTDLLYAHLRRQLHLKYGIKPMINEQEAVVILK